MKIPEINLRAMEPEDLELLYTVENDRSVWNIGLTNVPYSRYALHDYIANSSLDIYIDKQVRLIIENAEHESVGMIDLMNFEPQHLKAEVGIIIKQSYRDKGYGIAALSEIISYAKKVLHLHQLYAIIPVNNQKSIQLFNSMNFISKTKLTDWLFDGENFQDAFLFQRILK